MSALAQIPSPFGTVVSQGGGAYVGYRWNGDATLRLPSGEYLHERPPWADRVLAAAVLGDRLGSEPGAALLERFRREWVSRNASGEFFWPVAAVDEWLAATATTAASPTASAKRAEPRVQIRMVGGRLLEAFAPRSAPTPFTHGGC